MLLTYADVAVVWYPNYPPYAGIVDSAIETGENNEETGNLRMQALLKGRLKLEGTMWKLEAIRDPAKVIGGYLRNLIWPKDTGTRSKDTGTR